MTHHSMRQYHYFLDFRRISAIWPIFFSMSVCMFEQSAGFFVLGSLTFRAYSLFFLSMAIVALILFVSLSESLAKFGSIFCSESVRMFERGLILFLDFALLLVVKRYLDLERERLWAGDCMTLELRKGETCLLVILRIRLD